MASSIAFAAGEIIAENALMVVCPQAVAVIKGARYARVAYSVGKVAVAACTGDFATGATELATLARRVATDCETDRDICVRTCMNFNIGPETGACILGCDLAYRLCIALN